MNSEIKLRNIQIVLFFKNEIEYNSLKLANSIYEKMPQIGQPNILNLPNNIPNEIRMQTPKIIFNTSKEINIALTVLSATINMIGDNTEVDVKSYVNELIIALNSQGIQIMSIGLVSDYICYDANFNALKEKYYNDELRMSELVNSSWFTKQNNLNIWKFMNVKKENSKMVLNFVCDVNNRGNEDIIETNKIDSIIEEAIKISKEYRDKIENEIGE